MRLRASRTPGRPHRRPGARRRVQRGEELLTEISAKFTPEGLRDELWAADFVVDGMWGADDGEFLLTLAHPYC